MDPHLAPPVRIRPISATPITAKVTRKHIENFLDDFQARSTSAQSGNSAVTVQLQKLAIALKGERKLVKKSVNNVDLIPDVPLPTEFTG